MTDTNTEIKIFLDVDGVLNSHGWYINRPRKTRLEQEQIERFEHFQHDLDPVPIQRLNRLIEATGAKVVISSTWRKIWKTPEEMQHLLDSKGFKGEVIGVTPVLDTYSSSSGLWTAKVRGDEIQAWIDENNFTGKFVILDDDADMAHLMPFLVKTTMETGLLDEHVEQALKILEE